MSSPDNWQLVPQSGSGTVPFSPDSGPLHFRQEQNGRLIMIGHCCTVVDIHIDEEAMRLMKQGGKLVGRDKERPVMTFTWDDVESKKILKTKLHVEVAKVFLNFYQNLCDGFVEDSFRLTREFVRQLYERYHVLLLKVMSGSVVFVIAHADETSIEKMESEKDIVLRMCKDFLRNCSKQSVNITLTLEVVIQTEDFRHFSDRSSSRGHYQEREIQGDSLSETLATRMQALAKQQALTRDKVKTIAETLSSRRPVAETETGDPNSGSTGKDMTPFHSKVLDLVTSRETTIERPFVAIAARVLDDHSVRPFHQSRIEEQTSTQHERVTESHPPSTELSRESLLKPKQSNTIHSTTRETKGSVKDDERYQPALSTNTTHPSATQKSEQQSVPQDITKESIKQTSMQMTTIEADDEVKPVSASPVSSITSAGGAKPKVKGASSVNILSLVRSARGDKSDLAFKRISESVEAALIDETPVPSRTESLSTVLCLDTSESMAGESFHQMKRIAETFIDGVEDVAGEFGLEENVAVVSMSGRARVVQHLTNDYARIRDSLDTLYPGGLSPIFETIAVALAALQEKGGIIDVCGVHKVPPRIIFITDGEVTGVDQQGGLDALSAAAKMPLIKLVSKLGSGKHAKSSSSIVWIPVGSAERDFLNSLAKLGKGQVIEESDLPRLVRYYRMQENIGKIYANMRKSPYLQKDLEEVIKALVPEMPSEDKDEIIRAVIDMLKTKNKERSDDFDNIYENPELLPLGTRVVRGPDWKWEEQDSRGIGTVINHSRHNNHVYVSWDRGGRNKYRYNVDGAFDLLPVPDCPRFPESQDFLQIGIRVQKDLLHQTGRDKKEDGNTGVVVRTNDQGLVKVRWDDGSITMHKFERNGIKELSICDPALFIQQHSSIGHKSRGDLSKKEKTLAPVEGRPGHTVWRWRDERGHWHLYSEETQQKLKQEYQKRPNGSCLITRGNDSFRVFFKAMSEKNLETSGRHEVEILTVDDEDLKNLKVAEEIA